MNSIQTYIDQHHAEQVAFLAELVKAPSDNPPGDCAPHAARAAELLEAMGFEVECYAVPAETVRANGMITASNLVIRCSFGPGPTVALNAHGDVVPPGEAGRSILMAQWSRIGSCTAAASPCRSRISQPTSSP
jgi:succinyl-diaminopimelate desuccinylase